MFVDDKLWLFIQMRWRCPEDFLKLIIGNEIYALASTPDAEGTPTAREIFLKMQKTLDTEFDLRGDQ